MKIVLDLTKTLEENAQAAFEKAKKAKKKLEGAKRAREEFSQKAENIARQKARLELQSQLDDYEQHWYHKYRWSFTRNGLLIVGGQNASANEAIIKHHTIPDDLVFHTDLSGSPFVLLRGKNPAKEDFEDAAQMTAVWSRGWESGLATVDVFHVKPEQVTKEANAGESLGRGAFVIRGETIYHRPHMRACAGSIAREGIQPEPFIGTAQACKAHCNTYSELVPGDLKKSDVAKQLAKRHGGDTDDYIKQLPTGHTTLLGSHKTSSS